MNYKQIEAYFDIIGAICYYSCPCHILLSENVENKELCTMKLTEDYINQLKEAIEDLYYFEFVVGKFCTHLCGLFRFCFMIIFHSFEK